MWKLKLLLVRGRPPERALAVGDKAVHRDAHRVDQHGFKLTAPERRTMIAMKFTIELDIGLSFLMQAALPQLVADRETNTHRRGRSKRSYGHCRRRTEIPSGSATGAARPPGWWRRRRSARPRRMRSGGRTRAANRPASSQSRPPHELSNGHIGQRLSEVGQVSCRVKPSFQLPLHVRLGISLTSNAVRLTAIRTPLRTDPRADLKRLLRQHHYLACREPNNDFEQTHLGRRIRFR